MAQQENMSKFIEEFNHLLSAEGITAFKAVLNEPWIDDEFSISVVFLIQEPVAELYKDSILAKIPFGFYWISDLSSTHKYQTFITNCKERLVDPDTNFMEKVYPNSINSLLPAIEAFSISSAIKEFLDQEVKDGQEV